MPGYKNHLIGGTIAYGITIVGVLSYRPDALATTKYALISCFPGMLVNTEYTLHTFFPPVISATQYCIDSCWPALLTGLEWFLFAMAGALFPDIDIKSKPQKWLYWLLFFVFLVLIANRRLDLLAMISIIAMLPMLVKHRGLFHRLWFVILFPFLLWWWISIAFPSLAQPLFFNVLFFVMGAISHLWLDMGLRRMLRF